MGTTALSAYGDEYELEIDITSIPSDQEWHIRRTVQTRRNGSILQPGTHPEPFYGPPEFKRIWEELGEGTYVITTDNPLSPTARWSKPFVIPDPPKTKRRQDAELRSEVERLAGAVPTPHNPEVAQLSAKLDRMADAVAELVKAQAALMARAAEAPKPQPQPADGFDAQREYIKLERDRLSAEATLMRTQLDAMRDEQNKSLRDQVQAMERRSDALLAAVTAGAKPQAPMQTFSEALRLVKDIHKISAPDEDDEDDDEPRGKKRGTAAKLLDVVGRHLTAVVEKTDPEDTRKTVASAAKKLLGAEGGSEDSEEGKMLSMIGEMCSEMTRAIEGGADPATTYAQIAQRLPAVGGKLKEYSTVGRICADLEMAKLMPLMSSSAKSSVEKLVAALRTEPGAKWCERLLAAAKA